MRRWLPFGLLSALALLVRLPGLGAEWLWYDEAFSALVVAQPLPEAISVILADTHPPLFYVIQYLTTALLGHSEFVLRLPSALLGAGSVGLVVALTRAAGGRQRAAWIAGVIYALMPAAVYYSREARMYNLLTFCALAAAWAVLRRRRWAAVPALLCLLYSHNFGALYAAPLAGIAIYQELGRRLGLRRLWRAVRYWLPAGGLVSLGYAPWLVVLGQQAAAVGAGFWSPPPQGVGAALVPFYFATFWARVPDLLQLHTGVAVFGMTLAALIVGRRQFKRAALGLPVLLLAPPALALIVSAVFAPLYVNRVFVPLGAFLAAIWGIGLDSLPKNARGAALAILGPLLLVGLIGTYRGQREKSVELIYTIRDNWRPGDAVYHINLHTQVLGGYYFTDAYPQYVLPQTHELGSSLAAVAVDGLGFTERKPGDVNARRVWLMQTTTPVNGDAESDAAAAMRAGRSFVHMGGVGRESQVMYSDLYLINWDAGAGGKKWVK